jgi:hypothetical protein
MDRMKPLPRAALRAVFAFALLPLAVACGRPSPAGRPAAAVAKAASAKPAPAAAVAQAPVATRGKRCGWLHNPTPANWSLVDRDGEWLLGVQGGYQAPGLDELPDLTEHDWVVTNSGSYGYGCACLTLEVDPKARQVTRILGAVEQKPIRVCRADKSLPPPTS